MNNGTAPYPGAFEPVSAEERKGLSKMRKRVGFWRDGFGRLGRNPLAMVSLVFIVFTLFFAFVLPEIYPYP